MILLCSIASFCVETARIVVRVDDWIMNCTISDICGGNKNLLVRANLYSIWPKIWCARTPKAWTIYPQCVTKVDVYRACRDVIWHITRHSWMKSNTAPKKPRGCRQLTEKCRCTAEWCRICDKENNFAILQNSRKIKIWSWFSGGGCDKIHLEKSMVSQ